MLFEETEDEPSKVSLVTRSVKSICAHISEAQPPSPDLWKNMGTDIMIVPKNTNPRLQLEYPANQRISSIKFASFGNPQGECGNFNKGTCHSIRSWGIAERVCFSFVSVSTRPLVLLWGITVQCYFVSLAFEDLYNLLKPEI